MDEVSKVWESALYALRVTEDYMNEAGSAVEQEVSYLANAFSFSSSLLNSSNPIGFQLHCAIIKIIFQPTFLINRFQ